MLKANEIITCFGLAFFHSKLFTELEKQVYITSEKSEVEGNLKFLCVEAIRCA